MAGLSSVDMSTVSTSTSAASADAASTVSPDARGQQGRALRKLVPRSAHARLIVARDHGFAAWSSVEGECDQILELAVDAVVLGQLGQLTELLTEHPDLAARRSAYGHRATLLHYLAANGVEIRRQVVPPNAGEIAAAVLAAGADRSAKLNAYGGAYDVLAMLRTSAHPNAAGVSAAIEHALATS